MVRTDFLIHRFIADTGLVHGTAWVERTAGRQVVRIRHHAADRRQPLVGFLTQLGYRFEQCACVRMPGVIEDALDRV